jgi:putative hydrolase of the HAD superfamily
MKQDWAEYDAFGQRHGLPEHFMRRALYRTPEWQALQTGKGDRDTWMAAFRRELALHAAERVDAIAEEWFGRQPEYHDANIALARALAGAGVRVGLLSNAAPDLQERLMAGRIDIPFHCLVVSGLVGLAKPDLAIYRLAAERSEVAIGDCFFIDDLEANVAAAREAGMLGHHFQGDYGALQRHLREAGYRW